MVTTPSTTAAHALAEEIDERLTHASDGRALLALRVRDEEVPEVTRLDGNPLIALAQRTPKPCLAACLSIAVFATDLDRPEEPRRRAVLTLAIACCSTDVLIRGSDGRTARGSECDGDLLEAIRNAVMLIPCGSCDAKGGPM